MHDLAPAPAETTTLPPAHLMARVALEYLHESALNPRKTYDAESDAELEASVRKHGVLQELLVRPHPEKDGGHHEIVFGHRRLRAARAVGLQYLDVKIREDLADADVLELQLLENLDREDLHPLEEAEGLERLRSMRGWSTAQLVTEIGRPPSYVLARLQLCRLSEEARDAYRRGEVVLGTAQLLARIPHPDLQDAALALVARRSPGAPEVTVAQARELIRRKFMLRLVDAPFDVADVTLPGGPCGTCPKRSGASPDLFGDLDDDNTCTDPKCHEKKCATAMERTLERHRAEGRTVLDAKASAKIFNEWGEVTHGAGLTLLSEKPREYGNGGRKTWKKLLGPHAPEVTLAVNPKTGDLVELIDTKAITAAAKKAKLGPKHPKPKVAPRVGAGAKAEPEKVDPKRLFGDRLREDLLAAAVEAARADPDTATRVLAVDLLGHLMPADDDEALLCRVLGRDDAKAVERDGDTADLTALAIGVLAAENWWVGNDGKLSTSAACSVMKAFGGAIDRKAIEKRTKELVAVELAADALIKEAEVAAAEARPRPGVDDPAEMVLAEAVRIEEGFVYWPHTDLSIWRRPKGGGRPEEVLPEGHGQGTRAKGWLYYVADDGDLARVRGEAVKPTPKVSGKKKGATKKAAGDAKKKPKAKAVFVPKA